MIRSSGMPSSGTAMERIAKKKGIKYDMPEYMDEHYRAMTQFDGYEYEPEDDREDCWGILHDGGPQEADGQPRRKEA